MVISLAVRIVTGAVAVIRVVGRPSPRKEEERSLAFLSGQRAGPALVVDGGCFQMIGFSGFLQIGVGMALRWEK